MRTHQFLNNGEMASAPARGIDTAGQGYGSKRIGKKFPESAESHTYCSNLSYHTKRNYASSLQTNPKSTCLH